MKALTQVCLRAFLNCLAGFRTLYCGIFHARSLALLQGFFPLRVIYLSLMVFSHSEDRIFMLLEGKCSYMEVLTKTCLRAFHDLLQESKPSIVGFSPLEVSNSTTGIFPSQNPRLFH